MPKFHTPNTDVATRTNLEHALASAEALISVLRQAVEHKHILSRTDIRGNITEADLYCAAVQSALASASIEYTDKRTHTPIRQTKGTN